MNFDNPLINGAIAALLGVLITIWFVMENPDRYKGVLVVVAVVSGMLGYTQGQPFIEMLKDIF
ncbi:hypothetical protein [Denitromonas sp.]|uniref:hypothetical protein n=1 Tax=Denitromonas sp. TaxID=2734609 RepID=UPI002AFFCE18|nr:hypothetical protein [Denitromonas sp.]